MTSEEDEGHGPFAAAVPIRFSSAIADGIESPLWWTASASPAGFWPKYWITPSAFPNRNVADCWPDARVQSKSISLRATPSRVRLHTKSRRLNYSPSSAKCARSNWTCLASTTRIPTARMCPRSQTLSALTIPTRPTSSFHPYPARRDPSAHSASAMAASLNYRSKRFRRAGNSRRNVPATQVQRKSLRKFCNLSTHAILRRDIAQMPKHIRNPRRNRPHLRLTHPASSNRRRTHSYTARSHRGQRIERYRILVHRYSRSVQCRLRILAGDPSRVDIDQE